MITAEGFLLAFIWFTTRPACNSSDFCQPFTGTSALLSVLTSTRAGLQLLADHGASTLSLLEALDPDIPSADLVSASAAQPSDTSSDDSSAARGRLTRSTALAIIAYKAARDLADSRAASATWALEGAVERPGPADLHQSGASLGKADVKEASADFTPSPTALAMVSPVVAARTTSALRTLSELAQQGGAAGRGVGLAVATVQGALRALLDLLDVQCAIVRAGNNVWGDGGAFVVSSLAVDPACQSDGQEPGEEFPLWLHNQWG